MSATVSVFWFRRDLRLSDNAGLYAALQGPHPVLPIFIFDTRILDKLADKNDARVGFIHATLVELAAALKKLGSDLLVLHGDPLKIWRKLLQDYTIAEVYTNHDYEPYALERDQQVADLLAERNIGFHTYKDQVVFEKLEVAKSDGKPYTVFTPYSKVWKLKADENALVSFPTEQFFHRFYPFNSTPMPTLESMGFGNSSIAIPSATVAQNIIKNYDKTRDFPAILGTSRLGIHFRFGTISIREKARKAGALNPIFLNELIWRDFYAQILANFPHVASGPFRPEYARIEWLNQEDIFQAWCAGQTGYPIVDAGMRELNATGHMHNRVRMIVASFLTKHLLIDWRWGEAYFAEKLLDFDLASNNGGWQWAAGCGTDAAPYFRIFSPAAQQEKFDPELKYVRRWVPEYGSVRYRKPIVDHKMARERCLATYKAALQNTI
jgi:deoxyribodipyrimidine photo-lyase